MFSHVMLGANDIQESKKFYDAILGALGYGEGTVDPKGRCFYFTKTGVFGLSVPIDGEPASHGNGSTLGFAIENEEQGLAWHAAGLANGGVACEDAPGVRDGGSMKLYLAYLRDPAGNKICAMKRV
ncbi:VOC family protein [uncultured Paraglaciecola sp.]|jgi:catechol 2,3-dioxygenase-like lactoylglutathione lyase family enzyme|uniref:VOC family protein n=1 Tax=uncultured Paraglaciecola sp. TaxID=1765024 RepID=UPI0025FF7260|nr:VOC family protein [uncultured Paraglaciecola sp.]